MICIYKCQAKCCKDLAPPVSELEIKKISDFLGHEKFYDERLWNDDHYFLIKKQKKLKTTCIFLNTQNRCSIYSLRPLDCQLFPFFVELEIVEPGSLKLTWYYQECALSLQILKQKKLPEIRNILLERINKAPNDVWQYQIGMEATKAITGKIKIFSERINLKS